MMTPIYIVLCVALLLVTFGRVVFRAAPKGIDWALEVAFIRLDFPPAQRLVAQQLAAGLAEIRKGTPRPPAVTKADLENSELYNIGAGLLKPEEKLKSYDGLYTDEYVK